MSPRQCDFLDSLSDPDHMRAVFEQYLQPVDRTAYVVESCSVDMVRRSAARCLLQYTVNLRDIEGRSALLLGKCKDNNGSCAIGPFIRLFDATFGIDDVRSAQVSLRIEGQSDGFELDGVSHMREISRDPLDLVAQTWGEHHQYPDGFMLFLGTMFSPNKDRHGAGGGFTHQLGDRVLITTPKLGALVNTVQLSTTIPRWEFGVRALYRNLAARGLA